MLPNANAMAPQFDARPGLPDGMLALLFTDIEGSTRLLQALGEAYPAQLDAHRRILRAAFAAHDGIEVDTQGDAFFAVFRSVKGAVAAVTQAQRQLAEFSWPPNHELRVRMGLHCGEPARTSEGYVGVDLHRGARLMSAGHGGQVLLSGAAAALCGTLFPGVKLRDLGEHRLKDIAQPEAIFELLIDGLPGDFPPLRTLSDVSHNLPSRLSPILGREREIEALTELLRAGTRLVTLLGPGGTGKTRLSLEIAAVTLAMWPDGAFFVPLAPVPNGAGDDLESEKSVVEDAIARAVARALGLRDDDSQSVQSQLAAHLKTRQMLLVLDNFEHLVEGAGIVSQWLSNCPRLQIVATSRLPLHLSGEREMPLSPLAVPALGAALDAANLSQYAAVALFIERARAVKPEFEVNAANAPAIAEICVRLDGLPLAIELAAARIKLLPPATMMARLGRSLSFLVGGPRDAAARQQTLRATIGWSYNLLPDDQKRLFRQLGVFRGGFSFESAEQVCAPTSPSDLDFDEAPDIFEGVADLLNQSLLTRQSDDNGEARFGMLGTIREFALEQLDALGEGEVLRERHLEFCRTEAQQREIEMNDAPKIALKRFEIEADNWRAAWNWAIAARPILALCMAAEATLLWNRIGATTENYERLETALRAAPGAGAEHRCRALHFLAQTDRNRINWARCDEWLEQLETLSREAELLEFQAIALDQRRWDAVRLARIEEALQMGASAIELRRACLEVARAKPPIDGEISHCEQELYDAQILQAEVLAMVGRMDEAWQFMEIGLAGKRAARDELGLTFGLYKYAQMLSVAERVAEARAVCEEVVQRTEATGDRSIVLAWYRHENALMALHQGDTQAAIQLLRDSYEVWQENAAGAGFLPTLHALAWLYYLELDWNRAACTLGVAHALSGGHLNVFWQSILQDREIGARNALGDAVFEAEFRAGAVAPPQPFLETALADTAP